MSDIDRELPSTVRPGDRSGTVVVLANDRREVEALEIDRSPWAKARVVPIVGASEAETHAGLAAQSRVGLVVDTRRSAGDVQRNAFARQVFHLDPRGAWVALRPGRRTTTPRTAGRAGRPAGEARGGGCRRRGTITPLPWAT